MLEQKMGRGFTVVGHVEGGEAGVGVAEHGLDGVVAVDSTPPTAGLPHSVENAAYHQLVPSVLHRRDLPARLLALLRGGAHTADDRVLPDRK